MSAARAIPPPAEALTETQQKLLDAVPIDGKWVLCAQILRDLNLRPSRGYPALMCLVAGDRPLLRAQKRWGETYVRRFA